MRKPELPAADRLDLLLPWINADALTDNGRAERDADYSERFRPKEVRHRLRQFVAAFDGGVESGWVRVGQVDWRPASWRTPFRIPAQPQLERSHSEDTVHQWLRWLLRDWLLNGSGPIPTPTLRFGVEESEGVYTLVVAGAFPDVVVYLVGSLLATSIEEVQVCPAPAASEPGRPNDWKTRCGNFFVSPGGGRPRTFCSDACRVRNHAEKPKAKKGKTR